MSPFRDEVFRCVDFSPTLSRGQALRGDAGGPLRPLERPGFLQNITNKPGILLKTKSRALGNPASDWKHSYLLKQTQHVGDA